jgi:ABC-type spermidine/putrescine transport system permease subunit II
MAYAIARAPRAWRNPLLVRLGISPQINALATIFVAVVSVVVLIAACLTLRRSKAEGRAA